jgi:hypothetical protein
MLASVGLLGLPNIPLLIFCNIGQIFDVKNLVASLNLMFELHATEWPSITMVLTALS